MGWRVQSLAREAFLNLGVRHLVPLTALTMMVGALALSEAQVSTSLLELREELVARGSYIVTVEAPSGLPRGRCEALSAVGGVVNAGAEGDGKADETLVAAASHPAQSYVRTEVTSGGVRLWTPTLADVPPGGVLAGSAVATDLGVGAGATLTQTSGESAVVAGVLEGPRAAGLARRIVVVVAPAGMADRCWVEFAPAAFQSAEPLLDAWFDTEGLVVAPFAFQGELTRDPAAEFSTRPTRSGWIWAGATGSLFYWLLAWMRRGEYALYAALGVPWYGRVVMAGVESFILSAAAFVAGLLWAMLVAEIGGRVLTPDQQYLMLRTSASAILPPTALGTLSGLIVLPKRVASALKER